MKLRRPRYLGRVTVLLALVVLAFVRPEAKAAKLLVPTWFGMERLAPGVYVEKTMTAAERTEIAHIVATARERMSKYYGEIRSAPTLFFCSSDERFHALGGGGQRGMTYLHWACVLPKGGTTPAIVAHEWSHAEM